MLSNFSIPKLYNAMKLGVQKSIWVLSLGGGKVRRSLVSTENLHPIFLNVLKKIFMSQFFDFEFRAINK